MADLHPIRVLIGDGHPLARLGLQMLIDEQLDMRVVAEADNAAGVIDVYRRLRPDVTLLESRMPPLGGLDAITAIREMHPAARGYVLKEAPAEDILAAIRAVHGGQHWIRSDVAEQLAASLQRPRLTAREAEVLALAARGYANCRIAARLTVSESTIKSQMASIFGKLGVADRAHAVAVAFDRDILRIGNRTGPPRAW